MFSVCGLLFLVGIFPALYLIKALIVMQIASVTQPRIIVSVTKLREHWDETNSKVMSRKTQLDAMLADSQRYEAKRLEVDAWLGRMEMRLERTGAVGHTADVLEAQLRDQKVDIKETLPTKYCGQSTKWWLLIFLLYAGLPRRAASVQAPHGPLLAAHSKADSRLPAGRHDSRQEDDGDGQPAVPKS